MAVLHEDTVAGGADISGDAPPASVRSMPQRKADVARSQNHRGKPGPTAEAPKKGGDTGKPKKENTPGGTDEELQQKGDTEATAGQQTAPPPPHNPSAAVSQFVKDSRLGDLLPPILNPQGTWDTMQTFGRVLNASLLDTHAASRSVQNIEHDDSVNGAVARYLFDIKSNPDAQTKWVQEEAMPWVLTAMASWEPWAFVPSMAATGPQQADKVPAAMMGGIMDMMNVGKNLLEHPQFTDAGWWAKMGAMTVAAGVTARGGVHAGSPFWKMARDSKGLGAFSDAVDRYIGGPKIPSLETKVGPGAPKFDPAMTPDQQASYAYFDQHINEVQPSSEPITKVPSGKTEPRVTYDADGHMKMEFPKDKKAVGNLAVMLGLERKASAGDVEAELKRAAAEGGLDPRMTDHILQNYDRYANIFGWKEPVFYDKPGDSAPLRPPLAAIGRIDNKVLQGHATMAYQAAHDLVADLHEGPLGLDHEFTDAIAKGVLSTNRASTNAVRDFHLAMGKLLGKDKAASERVMAAIQPGGEGIAGKAPNLSDKGMRFQIGKASFKGATRSSETTAWVGDFNKALTGDGVTAAHIDDIKTEFQIPGGIKTIEEAQAYLEAQYQKGLTGEALYATMPAHEQAAVDLHHRVYAELRKQGIDRGHLKGEQGDYAPHVKNVLESKELAKVSAEARGLVKEQASFFTGSGGRLLTTKKQAPRSVKAHYDPTQDRWSVEVANKTVHEANAARAEHRAELRDNILNDNDPRLAELKSNPKLLDAVIKAELPNFHTDILSAQQADLGKSVAALHTHDVLETARNTLVKDPVDGRWHPLVVDIKNGIATSNPMLAKHFKELHNTNTSAAYFRSALKYTDLKAPGLDGTLWHPSLGDILNRSLAFGKAPDGAWNTAKEALIRLPQKLIMWNFMWHGGNGLARLAGLAGGHPIEFMNTLSRLDSMAHLRGLDKEQAQGWWRAQSREWIRSGGIKNLPEDVPDEIARFHMNATGDPEMGDSMVTRHPVAGFTSAAASAVGAVKGGVGYAHHASSSFLWSQFNNLGTFAYVINKQYALKRGMGEVSAKAWAAGKANNLKGTVSPDRWMYNPIMKEVSQVAAFAPGWWRTWFRELTGSYDRMGINDPHLKGVWAKNTIQTVIGLYLAKQVTSNALNFIGSGHLMSQNPDGFKDKIVLDNLMPPDADMRTKGSHYTVDQIMGRQMEDTMKALGMSEGVQHSGELIPNTGIPKEWKPSYAASGTAQVAAARAAPWIQAASMAANFNLYMTIRNQAQMNVDPKHPSLGGSPAAAALALTQLTPFAFMVQAAVQSGLKPGDTTIKSGPLAGTTVPTWLTKMVDVKNPYSLLAAGMGARVAAFAPRTEGRQLSTQQQNDADAQTQKWADFQVRADQAVMQGKESLYDWQKSHYEQARLNAATMSGIYPSGSSQYEQGASGVYAKYISVYDDKDVHDPVTGDVDYALVNRRQDAILAAAGPETTKLVREMQRKEELKHPLLRVHRDTQDAFLKFQDQYARANGTDGESLRHDLSGYYKAKDRRAYDQQHPNLRAYYGAKERWEMTTGPGFMYGLFHNQSYVMNYVQAHHLSEQKIAADAVKVAEQEQAAEKTP